MLSRCWLLGSICVCIVCVWLFQWAYCVRTRETVQLMKRPVSDRHQAEGGVMWMTFSTPSSVIELSSLSESVFGWWDSNSHFSSLYAAVMYESSCCIITSPFSDFSLWLPNPSCLRPLRLSASKQFADEVLQCHNEFRRKHQAPPLKLSSKLSREAARWVNAHTNQIRNLISKDYAYQSLSNCSG